VSVTQIDWYKENKRFAVGYSDGLICLHSKHGYTKSYNIEAHEVPGALKGGFSMLFNCT